MIEKLEKKLTVYKIYNREFDTLKQAQEYEETVHSRVNALINVVPLVKNNAEVIWKVEDEGAVDFGSHGGRVLIGYFRGTRQQILQRLLSEDKFWGYGPGRVSIVEPEVLS